MPVRFLLTAIIVLAGMFSAWGRHYVTGADLGDSTLVMAVYHVQVGLPKSKAGKLEIYWNRYDSGCYYRAEVDVPAILDLDVNHPAIVYSRIYERCGATDSLISIFKEPLLLSDAISLRLSARGGGANICVCGLQPGEPHVVPYKPEPAGTFAAAASDHLVGKRHTLIYAPIGKAPVFENWTIEEINEYISTSSDANEGFWKHLDRDFPVKGVRLHHKYILASISDGDGGYYLVDVTTSDGALPLKAHLRPTIFSNNYDMEWYPAQGEVQNDDCYAEISMDAHLLTINLPVHKASFRLQRVKMRE